MTILPASSRAAQLMREIADGNPAKEIAAGGKVPANPPDVSLGYNKCNQLLGIEIPPKKVDEILGRFGLSKATSTHLHEVPARPARKKAKKEESTWKIPSYRRDLQRDVDLVEEIVRAYGVQKIAGTDRSRFTPTSPADISHDLESALRERLAKAGRERARGFTWRKCAEQTLEVLLAR